MRDSDFLNIIIKNKKKINTSKVLKNMEIKNLKELEKLKKETNSLQLKSKQWKYDCNRLKKEFEKKRRKEEKKLLNNSKKFNLIKDKIISSIKNKENIPFCEFTITFHNGELKETKIKDKNHNEKVISTEIDEGKNVINYMEFIKEFYESNENIKFRYIDIKEKEYIDCSYKEILEKIKKGYEKKYPLVKNYIINVSSITNSGCIKDGKFNKEKSEKNKFHKDIMKKYNPNYKLLKSINKNNNNYYCKF